MPPLLIAAVVVGGGLLLFFRGGSSSSSAPRVYTLADVPKLRQLLLEKNYLGRELRICMQEAQRHSLFTTDQYIAYGVGLFTGVVTLNPGTALSAARASSAALDKLGVGKAPSCAKELELTKQQLANHDQTCRELGFPVDVTYEQVMSIVKSIKGVDLNYDPKGDADAWDRCVRSSGLTDCKNVWKEPGHPPISYDPKTGLAIRRY